MVSIPSSSGLIFDPTEAVDTIPNAFEFQSLLRQDSSSILFRWDAREQEF